MEEWVLLALISALFAAARHITIKRWCSEVPPELLVFLTRLAGTVVLFPLVKFRPVAVSSPGPFAGTLAVTVIVTAIATIAQTCAIQKYPMSSTVPYLSFIPIFMLPWTFLILKQTPTQVALGGIVATCLGAYLLNIRGGVGLLAPLKAMFASPGSRIMLGVAFALGLTTTCDTIAIRSSSAFAYTFIWTSVSAAVMAGVLVRVDKSAVAKAIRNPFIYVQTLLWAVAFLSQMAGVGKALQVSAGTAYVKALTMLSVVLAVAVGGKMFAETQVKRKVFASALMVAGAVLIVFAR